jgi:hypothetical protein
MAPVSAPGGNIPHGLQYLTMVDQLLVQQKVEMLEGQLSTSFLLIMSK